jgi:hypothetical protein
MRRLHTKANPDGYLIEVGEYPGLALDWFKNHS